MSAVFCDDFFESAIKPFILDEQAAMDIYDAQRPAGHPYAFPAHSIRVAADMLALAEAMGLEPDLQSALHWASLIHDAGKRCLPVAIWDQDDKPDESTRQQRRTHTLLGVGLVDAQFGPDNRHPFLVLLRDLMAHHHETLDGRGWLGLTAADLSREVRMLCVCDAFDGYSTWRPHYEARNLSTAAVLDRMAIEKAGQFDPDILALFRQLKEVHVKTVVF